MGNSDMERCGPHLTDHQLLLSDSRSVVVHCGFWTVLCFWNSQYWGTQHPDGHAPAYAPTIVATKGVACPMAVGIANAWSLHMLWSPGLSTCF
jgi:hypothetical protein